MKALWKVLMLFAFCLKMIFAQVTISSPTLNAKGGIVQESGNLTVSFSLSGITLATGDTITLTFPTGVSIASATPGWTQAFGFTISACAYTSGSNTLVMTASVTGSAPTLLIVEVDNFVYPISKLNNWPATGGTQISIDSGGTQKGTATNAKITNVNSGSITSITINHDATKPNVGDTDATLFFSINAPHSLPADGTIDITFPVQPVTGNDVVVSPTCTQSGGTMSTSMTCSYSSTTNIVTISSPLTTARSGEFNFTISGITNPISTAAVSGIDVKTKASDGGNIDTGTQSWSVPNPLTITGATWSLSDTNKVSAYSTHAISFTLNVPAEAQPQIEFIFPTDVPIDNTILGSYIGGTLFKSGSSFITNTETHVRIVGSDSSNSAGGISFISFSRIRNPNKIKTTASLSMNIYTSGGDSIATFSTGVTIASTALTSGSTNIASITPSSTIVQTSNVGYTVTFNPGNAL